MYTYLKQFGVKCTLYVHVNLDYLELDFDAKAEADDEDDLVMCLCWKNTHDLSSADSLKGVSVGPVGISSIPILYSVPNSVFFGHSPPPDVDVAVALVYNVLGLLDQLAQCFVLKHHPTAPCSSSASGGSNNRAFLISWVSSSSSFEPLQKKEKYKLGKCFRYVHVCKMDR